ncbi:hypothetical protein AMC80_PE00461 (plasmid) [Rhizobium phaseoli]|nr:hypothetical protein AMC80_PE00461 [Rhizobium phaseoli]
MTRNGSEGQTSGETSEVERMGAAALWDQHDGRQTMTTAFILVALALIGIYAGPTLLFICVGYADYMLERRRHLLALKHVVRRRSDKL